MPYQKAKVYSDGKHYIAIPHTERPHRRKRYKEKEEEILVPTETIETNGVEEDLIISETKKEYTVTDNVIVVEKEETPKVRKITKKQLFEETYKAHYTDRKAVRRKVLIDTLLPYFRDKESATRYVDANLERKQKNMIARRIRMTRKANLADFNFFVTFTFDDELQTEESFRKKLKKTLANFTVRKGWKYIGVWERSPEKKRLHFHGMIYIPEGTLPGEMTIKSTYSFTEKKRKKMNENSYFRERFGRNDFESMNTEYMLGEAVSYIVKYIEKSGEKIIYSRNLPQYFISDIMDEDVICPMGEDEQKLLLFDNCSCWDEGCYIGKVSKEVIAQMPKSN